MAERPPRGHQSSRFTTQEFFSLEPLANSAGGKLPRLSEGEAEGGGTPIRKQGSSWRLPPAQTGA